MQQMDRLWDGSVANLSLLCSNLWCKGAHLGEEIADPALHRMCRS